MSAIGGIIQFQRQPCYTEQCETMMRELSSYYGDRMGTWMNDQVFLACQATWITPEAVGELNPLHDQLRHLVIVSDACIDNRDELISKLGLDPRGGRAISDGEILLHAYAKWKEHAVHHLLGDYAFAVWDEDRRELFAARDPFGNRTFYYMHNGKQFAFCTTMRPLLKLPEVSDRLHEAWLAEFLAIKGMHETASVDITPYHDLLQLPPSHTLILKEGKVLVSRYDVLSAQEELRYRTNGEYEEAFVDILRRAVADRLRTKKQVSATLSGGLDSGSVVSFAAPSLLAQGKQLHAISYIPVEDYIDWTPSRFIPNERPFIEKTIDFVGNIRPHYESFPGRSPFTEIDAFLDILEMPYKYFENSFWLRGVYEVAAERDAGVLLTGAGGNFTISWGPAIDYYAYLVKQFQWIRLYREATLFQKRMGYGRKRIWSMIGKKAFPSLVKRLAAEDAAEIFPDLIHPDFARSTDVYSRLDPLDRGINEATVNSIVVRNERLLNPAISNKKGNMMTKFSLRYGIWERDPTEDLRVVQFSMQVPMEQFVQDGMDRSLIRRSMKGYLPDEVRLNQRTRGIQAADWLHRTIPDWPLVRQELDQLIHDSRVSGILHVDAIRKAMEDMGPAPEANQAFHPQMKLLMRALIFYRFLKRHS